MKVCTKCGELKPLSSYSLKRQKGRKPGLQPRCKSCATKDTKEWTDKNASTARERYLQGRYGISEVEYLQMLGSNCPICNKVFKTESFGPDSPVVDHCHTTNKVRGVICNECNRGLGYFRDNVQALLNAATYLKEK